MNSKFFDCQMKDVFLISEFFRLLSTLESPGKIGKDGISAGSIVSAGGGEGNRNLKLTCVT